MDASIADKVEAFFSQYPKRTYKKGQILLHPDDDLRHMYQITSGRVKQYDISYRGDEVVLNGFKSPAFFPMAQAMNGTPNKYFFEVELEADIRIIPAAEAVEFIKANPDVLYDLLARVYSGIDGLLGRMAHLMAGTAKSRVLFELLVEASRFGVPNDTGMLISLSEADLGARAGLARETVSREIHKLKAEGVVSAWGKGMVINDYERLQQLVTFEL